MAKRPFVSFDSGYGMQSARMLGGNWPINAMAADYLEAIERKLHSYIMSDDEGKEHSVDLERFICPKIENIYRAFELTAPSQLRCIILGHDPYPNPRHATGLAFGVPAHTQRLPGSLLNIICEVYQHKFKDALDFADFDVTLESWARQGVLLLNTCLTTLPGQPGAHDKLGWQLFTEGMLSDIAHTHADRPLCIMLWGKKAQEYKHYFTGFKHLVLEAPHPSPLSAHTGFLGCGHFETASNFFRTNGLRPINWKNVDANEVSLRT